MSGTITGSRGNSTTTNPEAMGAAKELANYLSGLDTSVVDNTYKNIANNAYKLSTQMPDYVYNVDGSDEARQRMESAMYNQAANRLNGQFSNDLSNLETRLQNQGLAVGSNAYQNATSSLYGNHYGAINDAAYDSIIKGQGAFSQSLNDTTNAASFNNNARSTSLNEILQILQNSISGYKVADAKYDAISGASSKKTSHSEISGKLGT